MAHRPALTKASCDSDYGTSSTALRLVDPTISWSFRHYADCTNRALWVSFESPSTTPDFEFYVGVGIPTLDRFQDIRADALIIGPGLPPLSEQDLSLVPEEVRNDPIWSDNNDNNIGAYFHQSPADQSTCDHLGTVMKAHSTVLNGRCDFFEPFSQTHSWRLLDADNNLIPVQNATYYVVVFLQEHVSSKFTVALGTWVEDFTTPYEIDTPSCTRDLQDFSEKEGTQEECYPIVSCPAQGPVGCVADSNASAPPVVVCELGQTCDEAEGCEIAGIAYEKPSMGACGGELCPAAVKEWEEANMRMHMGMMNLDYTGNADIDFVRGMIPHHVGAVDMCRVLMEELTCTTVEDLDSLEGLVHFCNHVQLEQEREVGGMREWLDSKGLNENAPCPTELSQSSNTEMTMTTMPESCGFVDAPSAAQFIKLNHKMHDFMGIEYSCNHTVDFVRMMLPHHAGAIEMCGILNESTDDSYLVNLCSNITMTQKAEIAWMHEWLASRELAASAPCGDCEAEPAIKRPCEDLLSTSSFCHDLGDDGYCRCDVALEDFDCDSPTSVPGVGLFEPSKMCRRTCKLCTSTMPLWPHSCGKDDHGTMHDDKDDHGTMHDDKDGHGTILDDMNGNGTGKEENSGTFSANVLSLLVLTAGSWAVAAF